MSGRFAIIGLTALAFLALGAGTVAAPGSATAEFRIPGIFTGKKVVKRKRYRRPPPVQPVRNPDRTFAIVSAETVSPAVAKNSETALSVGTASAASLTMALPAATRIAANAEPAEEGAPEEAGTDTAAKTDQSADKDKTDDKTEGEADSAAVADGSDADGNETDSEQTAEAKPETDTAANDKTAADDAKAEDADSTSEETAAEEDDSETVSDTKTTADESSESAADDAKADADETSDNETAKRDENDETPDTAVADATSTPSDDTADGDTGTPETAAVSANEPTAGNDSADIKSADAESADTDAADTKTAASAATADEKTAYKKDEQPAAEETAASEAVEETAADQKAEGELQPKSADSDASETTETASADASAKPDDEADQDRSADGTKPDATDAAAENETAGTDEPTKAADAAAPDAASTTNADSDDTATTQADATEADTKSSDAKTATAESAKADVAESETVDAKEEDVDSKDIADNTEEPAEQDETPGGEIITASLPPAPEPKPEIARMASQENTPERLAETASDAREDDPANDGDVTASISPASEEDGVASSVESADVTDVARETDEAPVDEEMDLDPRPFDPRAYDDTVVLNVSPPPGSKRDGEDTEVAALEPGSARLTAGDAEAESEDKKEAVDLGPPPPPPVDPVIESVRLKLEGATAPKVATADLDALKALYAERDDDPLWVSEDGLTSDAKTLIVTIRDAGDWGLDPDAYALPASDIALTTDEAKADAELALSAAVLKYARHAQTGRLTPSSAHRLFDFDPKARDPKTVLTELSASDTPDKTLLALHPQGEQYQRLHTALVQARDSAKQAGRNPDNDRTVQLIAINMERWRWLPSDLGNFHVWNNIPEFKFRVLKGGRAIYEEKTIVGQTQYATAFFSAPMRNIVFNPNWTVPPTIVKEDIAPKLKAPQRSGGLFGGRESRNRMLARYGLKVSKGGKPVDADAVDWQSVNVHTYTFQQDPGPHNVLGQFKFNFPNSHAIYMHDTTQKELFARRIRTLSHGCIRVNQPAQFAAFLLNEDKGWSMGTVQDILARSQGQTKVIALEHKIPVHLTYNTAVADGYGSIREFGDVYGIDNRMAAKLFKNPAHFNVPVSGPEIAETSPTQRYSEPRRRRTANSVDDFISGILGN